MYKITNLINNKIYIGVHRTENIDDGYMGSGKVIRSAIKKYGIDNFRKDILEFFNTYEDALVKEKEIVTDEFLLREDVYNLRRGGSGGFDYINRLNLNDRTGAKLTEEQRKNISIGRLLAVTDEFRNIQSKKMLGNSIGIGNKGNRLQKSETHRRKIAESVSNNKEIYKIVDCPYCLKQGAKNAMNRWHFSKCKLRD